MTEFNEEMSPAQSDEKNSVDQSNYSGQKWLITGAAGGLGSAFARYLSDHGATLILLDKNQKALHQLADEIDAKNGEQAFLFPVDLAGATPEDYFRLVEALKEHVGELDGCIHTAAQFEGLSPLQQIPATQWWLSIQANLSAPLLLFRELIPLLRDRNGKLVFILDELNRVAEAFWGPYGVAQWGMHALVQQWAAELSNQPIAIKAFTLPPFRSALRGKAYPIEDPGKQTDPECLAKRICSLLQDTDQLPTINNLHGIGE